MSDGRQVSVTHQATLYEVFSDKVSLTTRTLISTCQTETVVRRKKKEGKSSDFSPRKRQQNYIVR